MLKSKICKTFLICTHSSNKLKIDVTKYEELEQVHAELRLKELLWKSMDEWDVNLGDWYKQVNINLYFTLVAARNQETN